MTSKQYFKINSSVVDANNCLYGTFLSFNSLNNKFFPSSRLIDSFPNYFSFHKVNHSNKESRNLYLDKIVFEASLNTSPVIVISDTSIKNNVTISIAYIHSYSNPIKKTLHQAVNITTTEAKLFAIRCGISQTIQIPNISYIIIITDSIHAAQNFFDSTIYPFQL